MKRTWKTIQEYDKAVESIAGWFAPCDEVEGLVKDKKRPTPVGYACDFCGDRFKEDHRGYISVDVLDGEIKRIHWHCANEEWKSLFPEREDKDQEKVGSGQKVAGTGTLSTAVPLPLGVATSARNRLPSEIPERLSKTSRLES